MSPRNVAKIVSGCKEEILVFEFGDRIRPYSRSLSGWSRLKNIEQLSIVIRKLIDSNEINIRNFLIDDAYIMQASKGTAKAKGAAVKAFLAMHRPRVLFSRASVIFVSETEDPIMSRHIKEKQKL